MPTAEYIMMSLHETISEMLCDLEATGAISPARSDAEHDERMKNILATIHTETAPGNQHA